MDWHTWMNTTANMATAASALKMQSQLASIEREMLKSALREDMSRLRQRRLSHLKEMVFQSDEAAKSLSCHIQDDPLITSVFAGLHLAALSDSNVNTAEFPELEWKEKLLLTRRKLGIVLRCSTEVLSQEEQSQAQDVVTAIREMPTLLRAIEGLEASRVNEGHQVHGRVRQNGGSTAFLALAGAACLGVGLLVALLDLFCCVVLVSIGLVMLASALTPSGGGGKAGAPNPEAAKQGKVRPLSIDEWDKIRQMFGELDLDRFRALKRQRESLVTSVLRNRTSDRVPSLPA